MPWTINNPPPPAKNWSQEEKGKCVAAANAVLDEGGDDEEAIKACISAAGKGNRSMTSRKLKTGTLYREARLDRAQISQESRSISLSFSSEEPVERFFGREILDHAPASVRLGRLRDGGPLLVGHNPDDQIGVVESVELTGDRVGRATVRFGRSDRAEEILTDVIDGIRTKVSVGYLVHRMTLEEEADNGDTYRVNDWEPMEISLVSIPADNRVGVGRKLESPEHETEIEERKVSDTKTPEKPAPAAVHEQRQEKIDINAAREEARKAEQSRVREINGIAAAYNGKIPGLRDLADKFIGEDKTVADFQRAALDKLGESPEYRPAEKPGIGMDEREVKRYSFLRVLNALANPTDRRAQEAARYEFEVSEAAQEKMKKESRGVLIPWDVLSHRSMQQRDLTVGTPTAGGHTVATDLLASSFIDRLENAMALTGLGTTMLTGLNGNIAIPRQTGGATAYWVAESVAPTESQQAFDQVAMSPETVGAFTDISRKLLLQSSIDIESFVRNDLALRLALEIDRAAINGSGSGNEPAGILQISGIGAVIGGTNGLAPTWEHVVNLETEVANDNAALGNLGYLTNTKVRGKLKRTEKYSTGTGMPVWEAGDMPLNGYRAQVSNQVPSNLTKGTGTNLSAILFGNWRDLIIGMWGGLDVLVDPYTGGTAGTVRVIVHQDVDVAVRHPESFAAMTDAITT